MFAFYELERALIVERTQTAIVAKKKKTKHKSQSGAPKVQGRKSLIDDMVSKKRLTPKLKKRIRSACVEKTESKQAIGWRALAVTLSTMIGLETVMGHETARRFAEESRAW